MSLWVFLAIGILTVSLATFGTGTPRTSEVPPAGSSVSTSPSRSPTVEPDATPIVRSLAGDRQGIPNALRSKGWIAEIANPWPAADGGSVYAVGILGTVGSITLPPGELALGVGDGVVASARPSSTGTRILIRELHSGAITRDIATSIVVGPGNGVIAGETLLFTGFADAARTRDGGVWALDLQTSGAPTAVVPGGRPLSDFGALAGRLLFHVSPSEATVTSMLGGSAGQHVDVIDVHARTLRASFDGEVVIATSDTDALVLRPNGVAVVDLNQGHERWSVATGRLYGTVLGDRVAIFQYADGAALVTASSDVSSRSVREILRQAVDAGGFVIPAMSTQEFLTFLGHPSVGDAIDSNETSLQILDVATGSITSATFNLGANP